MLTDGRLNGVANGRARARPGLSEVALPHHMLGAIGGAGFRLGSRVYEREYCRSYNSGWRSG